MAVGRECWDYFVCYLPRHSFSYSLINVRAQIYVFPHTTENDNENPKANAGHAVIDDVVLNGPTLDVLAAENFIHQSMAIIMEDAVKKATDVREKVKVQLHTCLCSYVD